MNNDIDIKTFHKTLFGYRLAAHYSLTDKSRIGLQWKGSHYDIDHETTNTNKISSGNTELSLLNTINKDNYLGDYNSWNLNYRFKNDSTGHELLAAAEYGAYNSGTIAEIYEDIDNAGSTSIQRKQSDISSLISVYTGKIDYTKEWKPKGLSLETGLKYSNVSNNSNILFQEDLNGQWVTDASLTNGYTFSEGVTAGYLQLVGEKKLWSYRIGVRAENTQANGFSKLINTSVIDTNYITFFPSAYVEYQFGDSSDFSFGLTYTSRITRPDFDDLEPYVEYVDSVSSWIGNPFLTPSYSHSIEASLIYMKYASIDLEYSYTQDAMYDIVEQANDGSNSFTGQTRNIEKAESYTIGLNLPYEVKGWTTYNAIGYSINSFTFSDRGTIKTLTLPFWYLYMYNQFNFPEDFSLEITYQYYSNGLEGIFYFDPIHQLGASITKKMFKQKFIVRFEVRDILKTYREKGTSKLEGFSLVYNNNYDTQVFRLVLTYNFGKLKKADYKDRSVTKEERQRINRD